ncbi:hypothetical protein LQQ96_24530 (plasmid) [Escherichia coli]|nr:hypothetical protein LQQ96_24530 [Escherichia coli]
MSNVALTIRNGCFSRLSKPGPFHPEFRQLGQQNTGRRVADRNVSTEQAALEDAQDQFFATLLEDSLVNAGMEMNRRIIGFAGVAELKQIENTELRAGCERRALTMARDLIVNARQFKNMDSVIQFCEG